MPITKKQKSKPRSFNGVGSASGPGPSTPWTPITQKDAADLTSCDSYGSVELVTPSYTTRPHGQLNTASWKRTVSTLTKQYEFCQDLGISLPALMVLLNSPGKTWDLAITIGVPYQNIYSLVKKLADMELIRLPSGKSTEFTVTAQGQAIINQLYLHLNS